jgi:hypothetical protein
MFESPKQLLFAINVWMKHFNQPELTMQDLIVRIADQQMYRKAAPRAEYLLEHVVENKRFELPVDLWVDRWDDITLSEEYSFSKRLRLPAHYSLAIRVLNVPWGSTDSDGNHLKVDFTEVIISYAFPHSLR